MPDEKNKRSRISPGTAWNVARRLWRENRLSILVPKEEQRFIYTENV